MGCVYENGSNVTGALVSVRPALWFDLQAPGKSAQNTSPASPGNTNVPTASATAPKTANTSANNLTAGLQNAMKNVTAAQKNKNTQAASTDTASQTANTSVKNTSKPTVNTDASPKTVKPLAETKNPRIGDAVSFGSYPQSGNGKEAIEWQVLDVKDGRALLLSRYALDSKKYHSTRQDITWEKCTLRKWLNEEFLNAAFTETEKAMIPAVTVPADKNPSYPTDPGNATQDRIFLLSIAEAKKYFKSDGERTCRFTAFAKKNGATSSSGSSCDWLLRSPGYKKNTSANVSPSGYVTEVGNFVSVSSYAIRPALWVKLNDAEPEKKNALPFSAKSAKDLTERQIYKSNVRWALPLNSVCISKTETEKKPLSGRCWT